MANNLSTAAAAASEAAVQTSGQSNLEYFRIELLAS
jgi:hypothetical protein